MTTPTLSPNPVPDRPSAVQVDGVSIRLGERTVLRGVDLDVPAGEWLTVVGPNGAGKSTLLRAIAGLVRYTGSVRLGGHDVRSFGARARARVVASVAQAPVVPVGLTVAEYVELGRTPHLRVLQRPGRRDAAMIAEVLALLDLSGFADRLLTRMSGGELQRVFLARALAQRPSILLLDEPTTALDLGHQQEVLGLVDRLRTERRLTVISTMHDLVLAGQYPDRLALVDAGAVVATGSPAEVLTEKLIGAVYRAGVRRTDADGRPLVVPVRRG